MPKVERSSSIQCNKLLVVDDYPEIRRLVTGMVGDLFEEVREADDGEKAVACYSEFRPDWVLMDVRMPQTNGLVATARITRDFPEARIIVVTNHDDADIRLAARDAGAWDYLSKENLSHLRGIITSGHPESLGSAT